jgi:hypothetical protein
MTYLCIHCSYNVLFSDFMSKNYHSLVSCHRNAVLYNYGVTPLTIYEKPKSGDHSVL